ncbi:Beta-glucosidase 6 [Sesamum angolense]|uniref:Beta-glucosidase 6 n=1 Tax=Sesamum angolense TaxID=2727404 RepID=A0AAE2BZ62_9LAMI|nr:Beta-glucosidase 6 [Sesamum angolense]
MCVVGVGIPTCCAQNISRGSFPKGFVFGTASSAFQYEGAVKEDGRGPTIWDKFAHTFGKVIDFSNADVANDQYHLYTGDVQLMKDMGMDAYRFSIAWSRIYPNGTGAINQAGIDHYNKLIDALLANGIQPYVTLYHWDLPQSLEDGYNGWLSPQSIKDFATYAETCFKAFGDRVKYWITFNEPHTFAVQGYDVGLQAPGRCSILLRTFCRAGNSATEPYIVAHNVLLSHATVVNIYKWKYQPKQRGSIGITLDSFWFIEPLIRGDYPRSMRTRVGNRLPKFSQAQAAQVKGAFDFIGINHYTTWYANENNTNVIGVLLNDSLADSGAFTLPIALGRPVHDRANSIWLYIVPDGIRSLMNYISRRMDDGNSPFVSIKNALKDEKRIKYHNDYLTSLLAAIKEDGCNVRGYFVWSLLDNWEWGAGFSSRFGLYYVDYKDNLKRYAKDSVTWFKNFLAS